MVESWRTSTTIARGLVVITISHFVQQYALLMLLVFAAAALAARGFYRTEPVRRSIDKLLLEVPLLGLIVAKTRVARFTRTLGTMIGSVVPILESLEITANTAGNRTLENANPRPARASASAARSSSRSPRPRCSRRWSCT